MSSSPKGPLELKVADLIILGDLVLRSLALVSLLISIRTYWESIGVIYLLMKFGIYAGGIAADLALLKRRPWGLFAAIACFIVGGLLVLVDASSLMRALIGSPAIREMAGGLFLRAILRTFLRVAWLAAYATALASYYFHFRDRHQS